MIIEETKIEEVTEEPIEEIELEPEVIEPEPISLVGVVTVKGVKLNIRKGPGIMFEIVDEVGENGLLIIDVAESTDDWYKVCTENSVEGYCMKQFVKVEG